MSVDAAYEKGIIPFMGVDLLIAPGALVPREETELLARTALDRIDRLGGGKRRVIDMCTGSGNLACAIAHHRPDTQVWCSDLTDGCVTVARRNVEHLQLASRVVVAQGDLFASLSGIGLEGSIDLVVCNPPYISQKRLEGDRAELLEREPREAFDGGPYGLSIHQRVVKDALPFLKVSGALAFEIGLGQERQVKILFDRTKAYDAVEFIENNAGEVRVVLAHKRAE